MIDDRVSFGGLTDQQRGALTLGLMYSDVQQQIDAVTAGIQAEQDYLNGWHPFTFSTTIEEHSRTLDELESALPVLHAAQDSVSYAWSNQFLRGAGPVAANKVWGQTIQLEHYDLDTLRHAADAADAILHSVGGPNVESTSDEVQALVTILTWGSGGLLKTLLGSGAAKVTATAAVGAAIVKEAPEAIQAGEITTYQDFVNRSVIGDNLEGHELWQHANLKAQGLATERLSTAASKNNPVIALDQAVHREVNAAQAELNAAAQTPIDNIHAGAAILRRLNAASDSKISELQRRAVKHAESYGY